MLPLVSHNLGSCAVSYTCHSQRSQYVMICREVQYGAYPKLLKCLCAALRELHFPGVDGLSRKIQEVKDFVDERVEALSRKQDSLGDSQDAMKGQLDDVQDGVQQVTHLSKQYRLRLSPSTVRSLVSVVQTWDSVSH